jgi:hypothetical protein
MPMSTGSCSGSRLVVLLSSEFLRWSLGHDINEGSRVLKSDEEAEVLIDVDLAKKKGLARLQ